jgi:hypothetical protein
MHINICDLGLRCIKKMFISNTSCKLGMKHAKFWDNKSTHHVSNVVLGKWHQFLCP